MCKPLFRASWMTTTVCYMDRCPRKAPLSSKLLTTRSRFVQPQRNHLHAVVAPHALSSAGQGTGGPGARPAAEGDSRARPQQRAPLQEPAAPLPPELRRHLRSSRGRHRRAGLPVPALPFLQPPAPPPPPSAHRILPLEGMPCKAPHSNVLDDSAARYRLHPALMQGRALESSAPLSKSRLVARPQCPAPP